MSVAEGGGGRDLPTPTRALAVGAHPDDIEFGCGGTISKWSADGSEVHLVVLTDGSKGTWDADADLAALVAQRRDEQRAAADALGAHDIRCLDFVDGELESGRTERAAVCEVIRQVRPSVLLTHDPWKRYRLHPDHFHAGRVTIDAIVAARDPHFFPGHGGAPHRLDQLLLFEADVVDHLEALPERAVDAKVAALLCHRTQWRSTLAIDPEAPDLDAFAQKVHRDAAAAGAPYGVALAEPFKLMVDL